MVVQGGHAEDAALAQLEAGNLQDDREGFQDEDATDDDQQDLLADQQGHGAQGGADGQAADIAHEDLGGVAVEPQETHACAGQRSAEDRQLGGLADVIELQVIGSDLVAGQVAQQGKGRGGDDGGADGQAIQ